MTKLIKYSNRKIYQAKVGYLTVDQAIKVLTTDEGSVMIDHDTQLDISDEFLRNSTVSALVKAGVSLTNPRINAYWSFK